MYVQQIKDKDKCRKETGMDKNNPKLQSSTVGIDGVQTNQDARHPQGDSIQDLVTKEMLPRTHLKTILGQVRWLRE